jgi:hypothetical protein
MFGKYALPSDDAAGGAVSVVASDEDSEYPAEQIIAPTNTGHRNLPSRPAKLSATSGYWELTFASDITVVAVAVIYHNFDEGLDVTIEAGAGSPLSFSQAITIPAKLNDSDDWTLSPWVELDSPQTFDTWRLSVNEANSQNPQVGRLLLLTSLRQIETDVRYGVEEQESRWILEHRTEADVELLTDMFNVRRRFSGDFGYRPDETAALRALYRDARNRVLPWLLIPDEDVNDAWFVRFEDPFYSQVRETIGFNTHPYRVRELSRGLIWP